MKYTLFFALAILVVSYNSLKITRSETSSCTLNGVYKVDTKIPARTSQLIYTVPSTVVYYPTYPVVTYPFVYVWNYRLNQGDKSYELSVVNNEHLKNYNVKRTVLHKDEAKKETWFVNEKPKDDLTAMLKACKLIHENAKSDIDSYTELAHRSLPIYVERIESPANKKAEATPVKRVETKKVEAPKVNAAGTQSVTRVDAKKVEEKKVEAAPVVNKAGTQPAARKVETETESRSCTLQFAYVDPVYYTNAIYNPSTIVYNYYPTYNYLYWYDNPRSWYPWYYTQWVYRKGAKTYRLSVVNDAQLKNYKVKGDVVKDNKSEVWFNLDANIHKEKLTEKDLKSCQVIHENMKTNINQYTDVVKKDLPNFLEKLEVKDKDIRVWKNPAKPEAKAKVEVKAEVKPKF